MMFPKFDYKRSKAHLKAVASLPCQHCGDENHTQAAHSNQAKHGKGRGIKASDEFTAALCHFCHARIDQGADLTKAQRFAIWDDAHKKTVEALKSAGQWPFD